MTLAAFGAYISSGDRREFALRLHARRIAVLRTCFHAQARDRHGPRPRVPELARRGCRLRQPRRAARGRPASQPRVPALGLRLARELSQRGDYVRGRWRRFALDRRAGLRPAEGAARVLPQRGRGSGIHATGRHRPAPCARRAVRAAWRRREPARLRRAQPRRERRRAAGRLGRARASRGVDGRQRRDLARLDAAADARVHARARAARRHALDRSHARRPLPPVRRARRVHLARGRRALRQRCARDETRRLVPLRPRLRRCGPARARRLARRTARLRRARSRDTAACHPARQRPLALSPDQAALRVPAAVPRPVRGSAPGCRCVPSACGSRGCRPRSAGSAEPASCRSSPSSSS